MTIIYLLALIAATAVIVAVMLDAVIAVRRSPKWESLADHPLRAVPRDRRNLNLAFVGADRRHATIAHGPAQQEPLPKAA